MQTTSVVHQLPFMDDQTRINRAILHPLDNLVEGRDDRLEVRLIQTQCQIRCGLQSRHCDLFTLQFVR